MCDTTAAKSVGQVFNSLFWLTDGCPLAKRKCILFAARWGSQTPSALRMATNMVSIGEPHCCSFFFHAPFCPPAKQSSIIARTPDCRIADCRILEWIAWITNCRMTHFPVMGWGGNSVGIVWGWSGLGWVEWEMCWGGWDGNSVLHETMLLISGRGWGPDHASFLEMCRKIRSN